MSNTLLLRHTTPPNQPQRGILTDYFNNYNNYNFSKLPDDGNSTETRRSCFNVNFNILLKQLYCASVGK
jgi:hypothetical protein